MTGMTTKTKLIEDAMASFSADSEWPENVMFYKPLKEQELLPDTARCYCIEALLAVHDLQQSFTTVRRHNVIYMTPRKGDSPFLRIGDEIIGYSGILDFMLKKERGFFVERTALEDLCIKGILSLLETKLTAIELYVVWMEEENKKQTFETFGFGQPEPLRSVLCYQKQREVQNYLTLTGWLSKTRTEILKEAECIFELLSQKLTHNKFIVGKQLSEADVFVYGHLQAIFENKLPNNFLLQCLSRYSKLSSFCLSFNQVHLGNQAMIF